MRTKALVLAAMMGFGFSGQPQAGVIYTNLAAFNAAVALAGDVLDWSEDFESFALGSTPQVTLIGGGEGEIVGNSNVAGDNQILAGNGGKVWGTNFGGTPVLRGAGATSLGAAAFGFNFVTQSTGNWSFNTSSGTDLAPANASGICCNTPFFVGWVGNAGETLNTAQFSNNLGMAIDNVVDFDGVPEPATLALLAVGLAGLGFSRRKQ